MLHQPRQDRRFVTEWFLRAALSVTLDGSDDSTQQSVSSMVTFALHISATRFLNAIIAGSVSLFSV